MANWQPLIEIQTPEFIENLDGVVFAFYGTSMIKCNNSNKTGRMENDRESIHVKESNCTVIIDTVKHKVTGYDVHDKSKDYRISQEI